MIDFLYLFTNGFTDEEKESCMPDIALMAEYSYWARIHGMLGFEDSDFLSSLESDLLREGLRLLYDAIPPEASAMKLWEMILSGGYRGTELLQCLLFAEGLLMIQEGAGPIYVATRLGSLLGGAYVERASLIGKKYQDRLAAGKPGY